jgi:uncharacterized caspase-like protein
MVVGFLLSTQHGGNFLRTLILCLLLTGLFQGCTSSWLRTPVEQYAQERRVALVIGNANYMPYDKKNDSDLVFDKVPSVSNDADDMTEALQRLGFKVLKVKDANRNSMKHALNKFESLLQKNKKTVGLFYFSGHGLEVKDETYMIPIEVNPLPHRLDLDTLEEETVTRSEVYKVMTQAKNRMNFIIFDACRSNSNSTASASKGVVALLKGPNSFIDIKAGANPGRSKNMPDHSFLAYATAKDHSAIGGNKSSYSLYTKHLLKFIEEPGLSVSELFSKISESVEKETEENSDLEKQTPHFSSKEISDNESFLFKIEIVKQSSVW